MSAIDELRRYSAALNDELTRFREENARQAAEIEAANAAHRDVSARLAKMGEALAPFVKATSHYRDNDGNVLSTDPLQLDVIGLTMADVWEARAALTQEPAEPRALAASKGEADEGR